MKNIHLSANQTIVCIIAGLLIYRLAVIFFSELPLFYDEAYYYYWSLTPDWGYFSKPPVVAWLITFTTQILPLSAFSVKLAAPTLYAVTAAIVFLLGRRLADPPTGALAAALFISMPLISFNSLFITTDAPLLFCWSGAALFFHRAISSDRWRDWMFAGIFGGLGLLSKYTMALLPISILLYLALTPNQRHHLQNPKLWCGFALSLVLVAPNLLWNINNQFITFQHTQEISQLDRKLFHFDKMMEFIGGQYVALGLITSGFFLAAIFNVRSYRSPELRLLIFLSLPCLIAFTTLALLSRANQNWAAPTYVTAAIAAAIIMRKSSRNWVTIALTVNLVLMATFYHYHSALNIAGIEPSRKNDPYHRILGWKTVASELSTWREIYPDAGLLSSKRKLLAYIGFYTTPSFSTNIAAWQPSTAIKDQYQLTSQLAQANIQQWFFVSETPLPRNTLSRFASSQLLEQKTINIYNGLSRTLYIYYVEGFLGYE